jgi:D-serine dehydratase
MKPAENVVRKAGTVHESYDPDAAVAALDRLATTPISSHDKGFAGLAAGTTPRELIASGARIADDSFSTPLLVLSESAIRNNIAVLADYCRGLGVLLAPHAKTTMSPELFTAQLAAGAWALTAANVTQATVFAEHGARRVLIANQVTDAVAVAALGRLLDNTPGLELLCYVDSVEGVALLAPLGDRALRVLVEYGTRNGRTGVRSEGEAVRVAEAAVGNLRVAGVSCFEGTVTDEAPSGIIAGVAELCRAVRATGARLAELGLLDGEGLLLSAGGSHYFDIVATELARDAIEGTRVVVRSGSYVVHDHGTYLYDSPSLRGAALAPFIPAITVRSTVLSRPEPGLVLVNAGRRDVSFDSGMPVVLSAQRGGEDVAVEGAVVTGLNDQHGFLHVPDSSTLAVGDTVVLGISHPCTTFDKWRLGLIADAEGTVTAVAHTFF